MASQATTTDGGAPDWFAPAVHTFSVDDYHRLASSGVLGTGDRVELVDGYLIDMTPIGAPHATGVQKTLSALGTLPLVAAGWHVRVQQPLTLARSEPQPDLAIVRGVPDDYAQRHPAAGDVGLVIEVADASLEFDRGRKLAAYAAEGIGEYWIIDLAGRRVEQYTSPVVHCEGAATYRDHRSASLKEQLTVRPGGNALGCVCVEDLLG